MKVGILTFHFCYNYGATLQCLGLYKTLKGLGYEVDVIDYHPVHHPRLKFWQGWGLRKPQPLANVRRRWVDWRYGELMRERFDGFGAQHMTFSPRCDDQTVAEVVAQYEALVVGSDQVWNRSHHGAPAAYFLDFAFQYVGRRLSYAACCGHKQMPQGGLAGVARALRRFDQLSVRNQATYEWVRELTGISAEVVCDPTILCDYDSVTATANPSQYPEYVLAYVLGPEIEGGARRAMAEIRKHQVDLPVVWVCSSAHRPEQRCRWADQVVYTAGPAEWLSLMAHASYVYTDSFHGTIFAMKFRKPFLAYYRETVRSQRLLDLSERYGVTASVVSGVEDAITRSCFVQKPDYRRVEQRMSEHRTSSLKFLREALC